MKRNIIALSIITAVTAWAFIIYIQVGRITNHATKNLSVSIYKGVNYASRVYDNTTAQVKIVVEKVNKHGRQVVYEQQMAAQELKKYPDAQNVAASKISVPGFDEKKDKLEVKYILTYNSNGSELSMQYNEEVKSSDDGVIDISI